MYLALNAICPYYTMFPLEFPMRIIRRQHLDGWVVDPFCGRGTTNFAARLLERPTIGIDSSPIAAAVAQAKLCDITPEEVGEVAEQLLAGAPEPRLIPNGEFWSLMYNADTLLHLCRLREALLTDCTSMSRTVLRAILLGALHGPLTKQQPSHLSNQSPRTYAPKPAYAVRFWTQRGMLPPKASIIDVIRVRSARYLKERLPQISGHIICDDSRTACSKLEVPISLVITSPPYYGMRTYISDQWLRNWFLGGPDTVPYDQPKAEVAHSSPQEFSCQLRAVWKGLAQVAMDGAKMVVRFGGINDRQANHINILKESLRDSGWRLVTYLAAGNADQGKRQARQFFRNGPAPRDEHDFYAHLI